MEAWKEELYHYGTPERSGRYRWGSGDRPYQRLEKDSLNRSFGRTFERAGDKKKIAARVKRREIADKAFSRTEKQGKDKPNISPAESAVKNTKRIVDDTGSIARKISDMSNRKKDAALREKFQKEASGMSNNELQSIINRMNLEDSYVNVKSRRYSRGKSKALEVIDIAGDVASVGLSVASIIAVLYGKKLGWI